MKYHLLVVLLTGGMWELDIFIIEHGFSGILDGNKNISFIFDFNNIFNSCWDLGSAYAGPAYGINIPPVNPKRSDSSIVDRNWCSARAGPTYG